MTCCTSTFSAQYASASITRTSTHPLVLARACAVARLHSKMFPQAPAHARRQGLCLFLARCALLCAHASAIRSVTLQRGLAADEVALPSQPCLHSGQCVITRALAGWLQYYVVPQYMSVSSAVAIVPSLSALFSSSGSCTHRVLVHHIPYG